MEKGALVSEILVGGVAAHVNRRLEFRGEGFKLSARKVGATLKSLGVCAKDFGRLGRGLRFNSVLRRKIHEIALRLGIDRRTIAPIAALEAGYGGAPCPLCEKMGLTGGLRFVEIPQPAPTRHAPPPRPPLRPTPSEDGQNGAVPSPRTGGSEQKSSSYPKPMRKRPSR